MTIWDIAGFTGIAALLWTLLEVFILKKSKSFVIALLKNWVGTFFIFSAVVKLVDPVGFSIKLGDYFDVFNMPFLKPIAQFLSFFILVLELIIGVALLFNAKKKLTYFFLLGMIIFFTILTGVSHIFNVVQDCGCFGDFLKITPLTSFIKDLILLGVILLFVWQSKYLKPWFGSGGQWGIWALSAIAGLAFTLHNFYHLPMWDFRAYKEGTFIPDGMKEIKAPVYENRFVYKNSETGEEKIFVNTFPQDAVWTFVSNDQKLIDEGIPAPVHDFALVANNGEDLTEQILSFEKPIMIIISHDVKKASGKNTDKIKALLDASNQDSKFNYAFLSSSSDADVEAWKDENGYTGTSLTGDATMLKTVIRSNPGLVLLKEGTVLGKWHNFDTPSVAEVESLF